MTAPTSGYPAERDRLKKGHSVLRACARLSAHDVAPSNLAAAPAGARGAPPGQRPALGARARAGVAVGARRRGRAGRAFTRRGGGAPPVRRRGRQADRRRRARGARGRAGRRARRGPSPGRCGWSLLELGAVVAIAGCERVLALVRQLVGLAPRDRSQRAHPREGAAPRAAALRGRRVLRQADARAPRGLDPAAVADPEQLPGGAQRADPGGLRRAADPLLGLDGAGAAASRRCRPSSPRRASRARPSGCATGARPTRGASPTSSTCWQRRARQGGEAVRPRAAAARPLPPPGRDVLRRRSPPGGAARGLGLRAVAAQHGGVLRLLRADRRGHGARGACRSAT